MFSSYPVHASLPAIDTALAQKNKALLIAPPGAGKTSLVPLHLLKAPFLKDKQIIMLEPRRIAARAAAHYMAKLLGEAPGKRVGYKMRFEQKLSTKTRILVVTEGIFTKMVLNDPELKGIGLVIFDEFHERSLDADFSLALALDIQSAFREDLRLLIMSATLNKEHLLQYLGDAALIESEGKSFPVDIRYHAGNKNDRIEHKMAQMILHMLATEKGSILAFLPGQKEIAYTERLLQEKIAPHHFITPLYSALEAERQAQALKPAPPGQRKIVLATSIAESAITIEDIRIVIDSGLARVGVFDLYTQKTRLETQKISQAAATQRAGRAGRVAPGIAVRLWDLHQQAQFEAFPSPEIMRADLSALCLDSAAFGVHDLRQLPFIDAPPLKNLEIVQKSLKKQGALTQDGALTPFGRAMASLPFAPALAYMILHIKDTPNAKDRQSVYEAILLALILSDRKLLIAQDIDLSLQKLKENIARDTPYGRYHKIASIARKLTNSILKTRGDNKKLSIEEETAPPYPCAPLLLTAFPYAIAKARAEIGHFLLANGRGVYMDPTSPLAQEKFLIVMDYTGSARQSRILAAARCDRKTLYTEALPYIVKETHMRFDDKSQNFQFFMGEKIGALMLKKQEIALKDMAKEEAQYAFLNAVAEKGFSLLPFGNKTQNLYRRLQWLSHHFPDIWPSVEEEFLQKQVQEWLLPFLPDFTNGEDFKETMLYDALLSLVPFPLQRQLEEYAPLYFHKDAHKKFPIHYEKEEACLKIKVQELYGLDTHPTLKHGGIKLRLELLSPAQRPLQITKDLPNFWRGSWQDIRKEMKGRYPKHFWPEQPEKAQTPTRRGERRKS